VVYRIDPDRDREFIEEFRRCPIGVHSPGLMRVLTTMRNDLSGNQIILVCRKPFAEWVLGKMPPNRDDPIIMEEAPVFASREAAEWEMFCRRWRMLTGERINLMPLD
jgi:hypothetical protein